MCSRRRGNGKATADERRWRCYAAERQRQLSARFGVAGAVPGAVVAREAVSGLKSRNTNGEASALRPAAQPTAPLKYRRKAQRTPDGAGGNPSADGLPNPQGVASARRTPIASRQKT
jgi:hypothetical protein